MHLHKIKSNKDIPKTETITVAYIGDNYNRYFTFAKIKMPCFINKSVDESITCLKNFNTNKQDIVQREYYMILYGDHLNVVKKRTWKELLINAEK